MLSRLNADFFNRKITIKMIKTHTQTYAQNTQWCHMAYE